MKKYLGLILAGALLGCSGDGNTQSAIANYRGHNLNVIWSPTSGQKATVIRADRKDDQLPIAHVNSASFHNFFYQTTGCRVSTTERIGVTHMSGRPFSIIVPIAC